MSEYKGIKGFQVQTRTEDPSEGITGDFYYNSSTGQFKNIVGGTGSWSSGGNFPGPFYLTGSSGGTTTAGWTAAGALSGSYINESYEYDGTSWGSAVSMNRSVGGYSGGCGPQTAGIAVSGLKGSPPQADITNCETYNGSAWTETGDLPAARKENTTGGTSTAALAAGGAHPAGSGNAEYFIFNGSTWTDSGNINTARSNPNAGNGSSTSMLVISGTDPATTVVESWNGSAWTEVSEVNTGRYRAQAAGVSNSDTLFYSGSLTPGTAQAKTEQWDGTSWTEVGDLAQARKWPGGNGTTSAAWAMGGDTGPGSNELATTEIWDLPDFEIKTVTTS